jgi:arginyl-tRNA synthetase
MLITYLKEAYPNIADSPPNITDLTAIYKSAKKRFDEDETFKKDSRDHVVKLQAGDPECHVIWNLLCDVSRQEFQKVYDRLDVTLKEVGESFYNPMIPNTNDELESKGLVEDDLGMKIVRLPHFTIPLIVRKSDGGFGYDSTDMAALRYRTQTLKRNWIIVITDAGQAGHFHMCYDAARAAGWTRTHQTRLDHIPFGVVCGEDGKRFKTRSGDTVRLVDLLDAARDRMKTSLEMRAAEGKTELSGAGLEAAAAAIGYGAVKYFDLKQHSSTDYIFSYDRMLDTKGDTAVYLLFAYARLASIIRKAGTVKGVSMVDLIQSCGEEPCILEHPSERALALELSQLGDTVRAAIHDLLPNRICDYLSALCVKSTDFVTKCHVLNPPEGHAVQRSRLLLCEATRSTMAQCFELLGIRPLDRI